MGMSLDEIAQEIDDINPSTPKKYELHNKLKSEITSLLEKAPPDIENAILLNLLDTLTSKTQAAIYAMAKAQDIAKAQRQQAVARSGATVLPGFASLAPTGAAHSSPVITSPLSNNSPHKITVTQAQSTAPLNKDEILKLAKQKEEEAQKLRSDAKDEKPGKIKELIEKAEKLENEAKELRASVKPKSNQNRI